MKNINEMPPVGQPESLKAFEALYQNLLHANGGFIEYDISYPKVDFLRFLSKKKNLLIHGSNYDSNELVPKQANCRSKKFGNLNAVYATEDGVLPTFYAIRDKQKFRGVSNSGYSDIKHEDGTVEIKYNFEVEPHMLEINPWSEGVVYILPKAPFEQGTDDEGSLIDEWVSKKSVYPLGKLKIKPEDFPFLKDIKPIKD